jgi:hypothetical protein
MGNSGNQEFGQGFGEGFNLESWNSGTEVDGGEFGLGARSSVPEFQINLSGNFYGEVRKSGTDQGFGR